MIFLIRNWLNLKKKVKKKILIVLGVIVVGLFLSYLYIYKSHRDISSEKADFTLTTVAILNDYKKDEKIANAKYADKTIAVKGKITEIDLPANSVVVDGKLYGMMTSVDKSLKLNDSISLKGRFLGYDELLEEMKMDQITIIK